MGWRHGSTWLLQYTLLAASLVLDGFVFKSPLSINAVSLRSQLPKFVASYL